MESMKMGWLVKTYSVYFQVKFQEKCKAEVSAFSFEFVTFVFEFDNNLVKLHCAFGMDYSQKYDSQYMADKFGIYLQHLAETPNKLTRLFWRKRVGSSWKQRIFFKLLSCLTCCRQQKPYT